MYNDIYAVLSAGSTVYIHMSDSIERVYMYTSVVCV